MTVIRRAQDAIRGRQDEVGSALVLALVFLVAIAILILALGSMAAGAFVNTNNVRTSRTALTNAETATTASIQYLREHFDSPAPNPSVLTPTLAPCPPFGTTVGSSDPRVSGTNPIALYCKGQLNIGSPATRVIDLYACSSGTSQSACTASGSSAILVHAEVTFNDFNPDGVDQCTSPTVTTSCGSAMTINSWDIPLADS
jgi:hypothetical protein